MKRKSMIRKTSAGICFVVAVMLVSSIADFGASGKAYAQAVRDECKGTNGAPRRTPAMGEKLYKELAKATALAQPEAEKGKPEPKPNYPGALRELKKTEARCIKNSCNPYEMASIYNYLGWIYHSLDDTANAINSYKKLVALAPNIPMTLEMQTLLYLGKLALQEERYSESLKYVNKWIDVSCDEDADIYQLRSNIHYFKNDKVNALKDINRAVKMVESAGNTPKESWWSLQKALLMEKESYRSALPILIKMVRHYPKLATWDQLATVYGILEQEGNQRDTLEALYQMGGFSKENHYVYLASLYINSDYPWRAAKLLQEGMDKKVVKASTRNLQTLAQAYAVAQELDKSIPVMERAAASSDSGDMYAQLVGLYLGKDNFKKAISAGKKAVAKKNLRRPGEVHLNMGIAFFEQKEYEDALKSFEKAKKYDATAHFADNWKRHTEREWDREKKLAEALNS